MLELLLYLQPQAIQTITIAQDQAKTEQIETILSKFLADNGYTWYSIPEEDIITPFGERTPSRQTPGTWYRTTGNNISQYLVFSTLGMGGLELVTNKRLTGIVIQVFKIILSDKKVKSSNVYLVNPNNTTNNLQEVKAPTKTTIYELENKFIRKLKEKNINFEPVQMPFIEIF